NRDRAELPCRGLHQEVIGLAARGHPGAAQGGIEEPFGGLTIARQTFGKFRRAAAVMGVDIADQRFRRFESGRRGQGAREEQRQQRAKRDLHRLYLHRSISYCPAPQYSTCKTKRMRELFDEVAGQSPLDPGEAVRRTSRTPQRKRFYKEVGVGEADGGFT